MKKNLNYFCLLAAMAALACAKVPEVIPADTEEGQTVLHASLAPETKATGTKVASFLWASTDKIGVWDGTSFNEFTLQSGAGEASAAFSGTVADDPTLAVYPAIGTAIDGNNVTITLPDEYAYSLRGIEMPMVAGISSQTAPLSFQHLGAIIKFDVYGIPAAADRFVFTATGKNITGDFTFDKSAANPQIETADGTHSSIAITFTPGSMTSGSFYVPVPVGTYGSGFSVALKYGDETLISKTRTSSITLSRAQFLIQPAFAGELSRTIWEGSLTTNNWRATWEQKTLASSFDWSTVEAGSSLVIGFTMDETYVDEGSNVNTATAWQILTNNGDYNAANELKFSFYADSRSAGSQSRSFTLTSEILTNIKEHNGLTIGGYAVTITSVGVYKDHSTGTVEKTRTLWTGEKVCGNCDAIETDKTYKMCYGAFPWISVKPGTALRVYVKDHLAEPGWNQVDLKSAKDGWPALEGGQSVDAKGKSYVDIPLNAADLAVLRSEGNKGLIVRGVYLTITQVDLVTTTSESETTIWTGSTVFNNTWDIYNTDLLNTHFNWSTISAGTTIRFHVTPSDGAQLNLQYIDSEGWHALPDEVAINIPVGQDFVDVYMTSENLAALQSPNQGLAIKGLNYTLTKITILR